MEITNLIPHIEALIFASDKPLTTLELTCLLYTSDAADERSSVDLGGRRIIKKKNNNTHTHTTHTTNNKK